MTICRSRRQDRHPSHRPRNSALIFLLSFFSGVVSTGLSAGGFQPPYPFASTDDAPLDTLQGLRIIHGRDWRVLMDADVVLRWMLVITGTC